METENQDFFAKYDITKLPALLIFRKGELIGKIEGYYNNEQKEELKERIGEILDQKSS